MFGKKSTLFSKIQLRGYLFPHPPGIHPGKTAFPASPADEGRFSFHSFPCFGVGIKASSRAFDGVDMLLDFIDKSVRHIQIHVVSVAFLWIRHIVCLLLQHLPHLELFFQQSVFLPDALDGLVGLAACFQLLFRPLPHGRFKRNLHCGFPLSPDVTIPLTSLLTRDILSIEP